MSLSDRRRRLIGRLRRRKTREREGLVLVEGPRSVGDALTAGAEVRFSVVSPRLSRLASGLESRLARAGEVVSVDDETLAALADTEAPQGVLAVVAEPADHWFDALTAPARLLLLDGVQDPGNVGTLIRSAAAFALDGVVLLEGTVDPWNPKAVRASAGMVFRCPVAVRPWVGVDARLGEEDIPIRVADVAGVPVGPAGPGDAWALVVGSEGRGVRAAVAEAASVQLRIPMQGGTESLNAAVAGSILMYELTRLDGGRRA